MVFGLICAVYFWEDETLNLANVEEKNSHWVVGVIDFKHIQFFVSIGDIGYKEEVLPGFLEVGFGFQNQELFHAGHGQLDLFHNFQE